MFVDAVNEVKGGESLPSHVVLQEKYGCKKKSP